MEVNDLTGVNHVYEFEQCSGAFVYTVDDSGPTYIKFSARVRLRIVLDKNTSAKNPDSGNAKELRISNTRFEDEFKLSHEDGSPHHVDIASEDDIKNSEDEGSKSVVLRQLRSPPANSQNEWREEGGCVDLFESNNYEGNRATNSDLPESTRKCEPTKYNLRQKKRELDHIDKSQFGEEREESGDISVEEESISQKVKLRLETKKIKMTTKDLRAKVHKNAPKTKTKEVKRKARSDREDKTFKKNKKNENELQNDEIKSNHDTGRKSRRKQPKPHKLLSQNLKCDICDVLFFSKVDFYNHRRNKGSSFQCNICGKDEPFEAHLMVHMLSHEPDKGYVDISDAEKEKDVKRRRHKMKCNVCGLKVSSIDSLKVHMILHTGESPYRCCVCKDQAFFSLSSLCHHQETHKISKRFQCKICQMRFTSRTELSKHKFVHEVKCSLCGALFPNKTSRTCHYRTCHSDEVKKCSECLGLFPTDEELKKHLLYHRKYKKEQCPVCGIVVTRLKDHMLVHGLAGENLFACDECPMKYKRKSSLNKHLLVHTGEKPYACSTCPKRFSSHGMLRKHLLTHTLERPFVCEVCGKQFSLRTTLVTHRRIHSEVRKYPCSYCLQAFNYKTSLEIHMKCKHSTSDGALSCDHCLQTFQNESSQNAHTCIGHIVEPKTSKKITRDRVILNSQAQPLQEFTSSQKHETDFSQKETQPPPLGQDQTFFYKSDQLLSPIQEESLKTRQEYTSSRSGELPTIGQETNSISHGPPTNAFFHFSQHSHSNQTSTIPNPLVPLQNPSMHPVLKESDIPSYPPSNVNLIRSLLTSNMQESIVNGKERKHLSHQSSTISSLLSAPLVYKDIHSALEQFPQTNFSNGTMASGSKTPSETLDNNK